MAWATAGNQYICGILPERAKESGPEEPERYFSTPES
jgi:hypothetical protein